MVRGKKIPSRPSRPSTYIQVLKQFTKQNNRLPEDKKLSYARRRFIVKNDIIPYLRGSRSRLTIKEINGHLDRIYRVQPTRICNPQLIPTDLYNRIPFYEIDIKLQRLFPDCIYVKITAGNFGQTRIFNLRNYTYQTSGVRKIVERIRRGLGSNSGTAFFGGYLRLRPRMPNNGDGENYYIEFILFIPYGRKVSSRSYEPVVDIPNETRYVPKTQKDKLRLKRRKQLMGESMVKSYNRLAQQKRTRKSKYRTAKLWATRLDEINKPYEGGRLSKAAKIKFEKKYIIAKEYMQKNHAQGFFSKRFFKFHINKINAIAKQFRAKR